MNCIKKSTYPVVLFFSFNILAYIDNDPIAETILHIINTLFHPNMSTANPVRTPARPEPKYIEKSIIPAIADTLLQYKYLKGIAVVIKGLVPNTNAEVQANISMVKATLSSIKNFNPNEATAHKSMSIMIVSLSRDFNMRLSHPARKMPIKFTTGIISTIATADLRDRFCVSIKSLGLHSKMLSLMIP